MSAAAQAWWGVAAGVAARVCSGVWPPAPTAPGQAPHRVRAFTAARSRAAHAPCSSCPSLRGQHRIFCASVRLLHERDAHYNGDISVLHLWSVNVFRTLLRAKQAHALPRGQCETSQRISPQFSF